MRRALPLALGFALVALLVPRPAHATLAEALDLATLVRRSDDIVVARAVSKSSRWLGQRIVTDVVLEVRGAEKGGLEEGSRIEVLVLGGAVGEVGMQVAGEASLMVGQEYVLFLRRWNGTRRPVGMAQGALPVQSSGGAQVVQPSGGDLSLVRRDASGALTPARPAVAEPRSLATLLDAIRGLL